LIIIPAKNGYIVRYRYYAGSKFPFPNHYPWLEQASDRCRHTSQFDYFFLTDN
ncbi:unnamed protein product, partial [marine sediment metagenome]